MEENNNNITEEEILKETESHVEAQAEAEEANTETETEKSTKSEKKKSKKLESENAELRKMLDEKSRELSELNDKYLRLFAEYDNFRKRTAKEKESAYADACCDTLEHILPVLDNLERAAQYNTEDNAETPMGKGLELTLKSFVEALSKLGVAEIEAIGKEFDPNIHNAVMHIEDENESENTVVEVFMKGYAKGDKVLRHSMVKVAN